MKNTNSADYSFRTFLYEIMTKRDMQVFAVKGFSFLLCMFFGLAFVIAVYNIITGA